MMAKKLCVTCHQHRTLYKLDDSEMLFCGEHALNFIVSRALDCARTIREKCPKGSITPVEIDELIEYILATEEVK